MFSVTHPGTNPYSSVANASIHPSVMSDINGEHICHLHKVDPLALRTIAGRHDGEGLTLLIRMAQTGHIEAVRALLDAGTDANLTSDVNSTATATVPLKEAILAGRTEVARILLDAGANIRWKDADGKNIYHWLARNIEQAAPSGLSATLEVLSAYENRAGQMSLINEHDFQWESALQDLIKYGASGQVSRDTLLDGILAFYQCGAWPTLEVFDHCSDIQFMDRLLKSGFDPNAKTDDGITLLAYAIYWEHSDSVKMLLDHGADPLRADRWGGTALSEALKLFQSRLDFVTSLMKDKESLLKANLRLMFREAQGNFREYVSEDPAIAAFIKPNLLSTSFESKFSDAEPFIAIPRNPPARKPVFAPISLESYISIWNRISGYRADIETYHNVLKTYQASLNEALPEARANDVSIDHNFNDINYFDTIVALMVKQAETHGERPER